MMKTLAYMVKKATRKTEVYGSYEYESKYYSELWEMP